MGARVTPPGALDWDAVRICLVSEVSVVVPFVAIVGSPGRAWVALKRAAARVAQTSK